MSAPGTDPDVLAVHGDFWWDEPEDWWVCPDAALSEQRTCREVYVDGELTVACAY